MTKNGYCIHGYIIDLLTVVMSEQSVNRTYNLWHTTSGITGGYDNLVKEIFNHGVINASLCGASPCDMAIGDITVNWPRRRFPGSRFSLPFMSVGLQIVARIHGTAFWSASFAFLDPFHWSVWAAMLLSLAFITFTITFLEAAQFRH